jgi:thioredoxin-like negative regulator of GroEL
MLQEITFEQFEQMLAQKETFVLYNHYDFEWCTPCSIMNKTLSGINEQIYKINSTNLPFKSSNQYLNVAPALFFFKNGVKVDSCIGVPSEPRLKEGLNLVKSFGEKELERILEKVENMTDQEYLELVARSPKTQPNGE